MMECAWCGESVETKEDALEHNCDDNPTVEEVLS